jgi:hypothetical protein
MKRFSFVLAMLAVALVLGLAFVGCKNEVEDDPLNGTYVGGSASFVLNNGNWTGKENGNDMQRGTYTASEGTITFTTTDFYFNQEAASQFNTTVGWKNRSQTAEILRNAGFTDAQINESLAPITGTYSGNTLTVWGNTLTRQ